MAELTIEDVRMWWHQKRSDIADEDAINFLFNEVARLDTANARLKVALKDIMNNQNDYCTTCDENVDTAADAINWDA